MSTKESSLKEKFAAVSAKQEESKTKSGVRSMKATDDFVYMENAKRGLNLAIMAEENIVLYGPGGFGKSELVEAFFREKAIVPYVKTMGSGTTTDSLFGGIDIKEFNASGKIEYLVQNSWMNHEFVVFEELLDAPDYILEQLKDILTSKIFRNGTQQFPIKTKLIVCCTNKERGDFATNDSLKALMERFPLEHNVRWENYNKTTYGFMFKHVMGKDYPQLTYLLETLSAGGTIVSPRTAIKAAKILDQSMGDLSCLDFIAEFCGKNKKLIETALTKYKNVAVIQVVIQEIDRLIKDCSAISLKTLDDIKESKAVLRQIDVEVAKLKSKKVDDEMMKEITAQATKYENFVRTKTKEIADATEA